MANWDFLQENKAFINIADSLVFGTKTAIIRPTLEIKSLLKGKHPGAPYLSIGSLAKLAIADLTAPDDQGHLEISFEEGKDNPMLLVRKMIFTDSPVKENVIIWIAVNMDNPNTHLWLHTHLPEDIILPAILTLADASITLTNVLQTHPAKVMYRSQFPPEP